MKCKHTNSKLDKEFSDNQKIFLDCLDCKKRALFYPNHKRLRWI